MELKPSAKASARYVRMSPRKVRQVVDLIRNKDIGEALAILQLTPRASSQVIEKLVKSAVANGENNFDMDPDSLYIAECYVDQGPTLKRIRPRAQGRAFRIEKKTSHITIILNNK